ncbi:hypothetical protein BJ085DRAFT_30122 [Dimargaris cristalligena]|uniref:Uncharacterized protein n=1 Tax=Dimargaris cristalligena TaxID=215637 RepID=A0A4P9ZXR6_9FUNG|nr:hypothetical protein BJ085DRAFT_30122 [Dimargaris cristalligena]|eukprot:RKP37831.1 hypothetical protein BJ085DRAFT_30122 [Dimargaris cristalligena]
MNQPRDPTPTYSKHRIDYTGRFETYQELLQSGYPVNSDDKPPRHNDRQSLDLRALSMADFTTQFPMVARADRNTLLDLFELLCQAVVSNTHPPLPATKPKLKWAKKPQFDLSQIPTDWVSPTRVLLTVGNRIISTTLWYWFHCRCDQDPDHQAFTTTTGPDVSLIAAVVKNSQLAPVMVELPPANNNNGGRIPVYTDCASQFASMGIENFNQVLAQFPGASQELCMAKGTSGLGEAFDNFYLNLNGHRLFQLVPTYVLQPAGVPSARFAELELSIWAWAAYIHDVGQHIAGIDDICKPDIFGQAPSTPADLSIFSDPYPSNPSIFSDPSPSNPSIFSDPYSSNPPTTKPFTSNPFTADLSPTSNPSTYSLPPFSLESPGKAAGFRATVKSACRRILPWRSKKKEKSTQKPKTRAFGSESSTSEDYSENSL